MEHKVTRGASDTGMTGETWCWVLNPPSKKTQIGRTQGPLSQQGSHHSSLWSPHNFLCPCGHRLCGAGTIL